jgi:hypothetical protein
LKDDENFLGAVASNAGDDFHILWATREMLRLLDANGEVTAVKVEGLPRDEIHAELGENAQAADITLVRDTTDGPAYRYLQLKHSASNPQDTWTWSRLLTRRAKTKPLSSVLGKLAALMKAVEFKGDFAIVSNQPLSASVAEDVARLISNGSDLAGEDAARFVKLAEELGLTAEQLRVFLKAWDLTAFASTSRLAMESEVIQRLARMADADARDDANLLQRRVATLMLPESRNGPPVTREILWVWLGAGSKSMLFPAPSQIEPARPYVRRAVIHHLGQKLAAPQAKPLRVHAGGGCGKTSLLCDLPSVLPQGSEVFLYDCYGGGLFLASDQKRHLAEQAFTQLGNELAARLLTPLVIRRQGSIDVFEALRNRIAVAANLVKLRNVDAQLVVCFDAVDNARTGARHWREPCFLDALSQASAWPDNVRIVVSCRTARLDEVGTGHLYEDFEVPGFDVDEVGRLVALWQPQWRPGIASTLFDLAGGNPRRLVYAVKGLPHDGEARAIERLMPKAEGINPLFEQRVTEASVHLGDVDKVWQVLDALSRLPRPVPAHMLARLAGVAPADIGDIAADVGGIVERIEGWSFHDEDFEAFVAERPGSGGELLLARAADLLLESRHTDRYAATSVAEVLAAADRLHALYALVTQEEKPSAILTPLEAQFVWSRRLSLAIRCCRTASDITNACSLLIASAEAVRRTELLEDLTVANLDLSVRFAAEEANRLVMVGQRHRTKRARLRIELARQAAPAYPGIAEMHLRWWHAYLRDTERASAFRVEARDIAAEYQTYAALFDEERAFSRLFTWRPKSALRSVFQLLAADAAGRNRQALLDAIDARTWPPLALAPLMAAALLAGADMGDSVMHRGIARLARATRARWKAPIEMGLSNSPVLAWHEASLLVCERAVAHDDLRPLVAQILDRALPKPELEETHHLYRLRSAGACHARAYALREQIYGVRIPVAEWLPQPREEPPRPARNSARPDEKSPEARWNEALREAVSVFSRYVDAARATLTSLSGDPTIAWQALTKALDVSRSYEQPSHRDPDVATLLMRNHIVHAGIAEGDVTGLISGMRGVLRHWSANSVAAAQDLASTLALLPRTHDAALELLTAIAGELETDPLRASERAQLLGKSARIALPLDPGLAQWLFGKAVEATGAVDLEARGALAAAGAIAQAGLGGSSTERAVLAARLGDAAGAVAESLDLGGDFPWDDAANWVTSADLPMGLVTAARWHDQGVIPFDRSLPQVIGAGAALSFAQRVALATLASDGPIDPDIAFDRSSTLPGWAVASVLKAQLCEGDMDAFLSTLDALERRAGADATAAIATAGAYRDTFRAWRETHDPPQPATRGPSENASSEESLALLNTPEEIRAILAGGAEEHDPGVYQLCDVARRLANRSLRVPFLNIALELGSLKGEFGEAVPEILAHWSSYPPVTTWMRECFPGYITGALSELFRWRYDDTETVEAALAATGLGPAEQADILLAGIERQTKRISADLLYALTGLIAARTPIEDRSGLFDALLRRVEARTSHPPLVRLAGAVPPQEVAESVARSLFAAMGDMDRRVRWRASHAALALMRGRDPAWAKLVACLANVDEPVFAGTPFYRYAALEQLMTVLQRATAESVQDVAQHAPLVLETIRREPHVIVRELGRSVLLAIDAAGAWQLTERDRVFVEQINRSQLEPIVPDNHFLRWSNTRDERQRKYRFDDTDAIPYWYQPVAYLFDMDMSAFLDRLESWIHHQWGYSETTTHWAHEPRPQRIKNTHELTSRRHGAWPTIERLSHHIEWHAMMCTVGELIAERPLITSQDGNAFERWMADHLPTLPLYWLSDLRDPPPLEPRFWGQAPSGLLERTGEREDHEAFALSWGRMLSPDIFDTEIAASHDLVIAANFEMRWGEAYQRVRIDSALVSPSTAHALAQALANASDRMDFALPEAGYHDNIEVPGFRLEAWLRPFEHEPKADNFDERRGTISSVPVQPVGAARREHPVFDFQHSSWLSPTGDAAIKLAQWGSEESMNGHGWRATASRTHLAGLLGQAHRSLVLLAEISRHVRDEHIVRNPTQWLLYVFDAKGTLTQVKRERRSLGRFLVRREGLHNSIDTLGRWMLHRAAELDRQHETVDEGLGAVRALEIEKICAAFRQRNRRQR